MQKAGRVIVLLLGFRNMSMTVPRSVVREQVLGALKVDADACCRGFGLLRNGVAPVDLASTAHHEKVSAGRCEGRAFASGAWLDEEPSWMSQGEDGDRADVSLACDAVAVPRSAVSVVSVEIDPQTVVGDAVDLRQASG